MERRVSMGDTWEEAERALALLLTNACAEPSRSVGLTATAEQVPPAHWQTALAQI